MGEGPLAAAKPAGVVPPQWERLTEPVWQQLQVQLANLSTNSQHKIVPHAGHNIQLEQPQVVIDAILDVVERARAKPPTSNAMCEPARRVHCMACRKSGPASPDTMT